MSTDDVDKCSNCGAAIPVEHVIAEARELVPWLLTYLQDKTESHPLVAIAALKMASDTVVSAIVHGCRTQEEIVAFQTNVSVVENAVRRTGSS